MSDLPQEICQTCQAESPDHWITDFWCYCQHTRVMCRRRRKEDQWTIERGVKPKKALKHFAAAVAKMEARAKAQGLSLKDADAVLTRLRQMDKNAS